MFQVSAVHFIFQPIEWAFLASYFCSPHFGQVRTNSHLAKSKIVVPAEEYCKFIDFLREEVRLKCDLLMLCFNLSFCRLVRDEWDIHNEAGRSSCDF